MDNYGKPIFDQNNEILGYKINETEYASVYTYKNNDNLICNKVSIREFDKVNLKFKEGEFIS